MTRSPKNANSSNQNFWATLNELSESFLSGNKSDNPSIWGFVSDETYFVQKVMERLGAKVSSSDDAEMTRVDYPQFLKNAQMGFQGSDLFGQQQVFMVSGAEKAFLKKAEWLPYREKMSDLVVIFLDCVSAKKRISCVARAKDLGIRIYSSPALRTYEFESYIISLEKEYSVALDTKSRSILTALYADQYSLCESFLRHLKLAFPEKERFGIAEIKVLCGDGLLSTLQCTEYLSAGRGGMAMGWIEQVLQAGESPLSLLGLISRYTQDLNTMKSHDNTRIPNPSRSLNPYVIRKLNRAAQVLTKSKIDSSLRLCGEADTLLKSTRIDPNLLLGEIIQSLSFSQGTS